MIKLEFKTWINEVGTTAGAGGGGTSTANIANYARPIGAIVRRKFASCCVGKINKCSKCENMS